MSSMRLQRSPTVHCLSEVGTVTSMPSTPPVGKKSGASRPGKITTPTTKSAFSLPLVMDGVVYFGCRDSNFYALDALTGEKKWAFNNKGSWVISSPAVHDGKVYFATSDTATVYALDAKTGTPIFSLKFDSWPLFSSP